MKAEPGGNIGDFKRQGKRGREMTIYLALCLAHHPSFLKTPKVNESAASFLTQSWTVLALQILQWGGKKNKKKKLLPYFCLQGSESPYLLNEDGVIQHPDCIVFLHLQIRCHWIFHAGEWLHLQNTLKLRLLWVTHSHLVHHIPAWRALQ